MEISENQNVNEFVTEHFINDLKAGRIPWRHAWTMEGVPFNPVTKLPYGGINQLLLASLGYPQNYFVTFKQIKDLEGNVKPGERGYSILLWKKSETEGEKAKLLTYPVFNISQCNDLPGEFTGTEPPENPYQICEKIVSNMKDNPKVIHADTEPYYDNFRDCIYMPMFKSFKDKDHYFFTLMAEMIMSTGSEKRLNRREVTGQYAYDSRQYALRQLTAEIGAWQLASIAGIRVPKPGYGSSYIQLWIEKLERDRFLVINAAISAQKAVNYILNRNANVTHDEHQITVPEVELNGENFEPLEQTESDKNGEVDEQPDAKARNSKRKARQQ